jgi:hypothetical protein
MGWPFKWSMYGTSKKAEGRILPQPQQKFEDQPEVPLLM